MRLQTPLLALFGRDDTPESLSSSLIAKKRKNLDKVIDKSARFHFEFSN